MLGELAVDVLVDDRALLGRVNRDVHFLRDACGRPGQQTSSDCEILDELHACRYVPGSREIIRSGRSPERIAIARDGTSGRSDSSACSELRTLRSRHLPKLCLRPMP
jgi:hypothetical protein